MSASNTIDDIWCSYQITLDCLKIANRSIVNLTTYQFLITSQNVGKGRSFCRHRMRRRNPRLNKETKLR